MPVSAGRWPGRPGEWRAVSTVSVPITGGFAAIHSDKNYKPGYIAGNVIHQGSGLRFSKGNQSIEVTDFVVDPGASILIATPVARPASRCCSWTAPTSQSRCRAPTWSFRAPWQADGDRCECSELHLQCVRLQGGDPAGVVTLTAAQAEAPKAYHP